MKKDIYAVIGDPIWHSLSPLIHNYLYHRYHIDALYLPICLNRNNYHSFLTEYANSINLKGLNVTMPLKKDVISILNELDETSSILQSVNTIDLKTKKGYTTDGVGFVNSLNMEMNKKNILMIGAGGAAKSIAFALSKQPIGKLTIVNESMEDAQVLADKTNIAVTIDSLENLQNHLQDCDLLINATPLGMEGLAFPSLDFVDALPGSAHVYDIIYNPRETELLKKAKAKNLSCQNGLDMLIYQAFASFQIFFGIEPTREDFLAIKEQM